MFHWIFVGLFLLLQFVDKNEVLCEDVLYTCNAWGDPHLQTWRSQNTPLTSNLKQDCYADGEFDLVNNQFVKYRVQTFGRLIIHASIIFYNPTTNEPVCRLESIDLLVLPLFASTCARNGITWTSTGTFLQFRLTVSYAVNGVNFTTSIQRTSSHFNVNIWQPQSWASQSNGLCSKNDSKCTRNKTLPPDTRMQTLTYSEAHEICQTYFNAYLNRSQFKRNLLLNNIVDSIMDDCIEDVVFTGDIQMAQSAVNMIMIEELTTGVTTTGQVQQAIDGGIQEASLRLQEATQEAHLKLARFR